MQNELFTLYSRIHLPETDAPGRPVDPRHVGAFNQELATLGYTLDVQALRALKALSEPAFRACRDEVLVLANGASGAGHLHRTLFNHFPHETPDQSEYLFKRLLGALQNSLRFNIEDAVPLSCGHVVDRALFDADAFGACPICQFQVDELESSDEAMTAFRRLTPLKPLGVADEAFLGRIASTLIARPSSLSLEERHLLLALKGKVAVTAPAQVARETLPFVYLFCGEDAVLPLLSGATDIMRIAVLLSDPDGDLSLKEPVRFKLATRDKKALLRLLESREQLTEDLMRHRERWLRLAERLNPGTAVNRRRFPKTAAAFDALRRDPKSIATFNRTLERTLRSGSLDPESLSAIARRPGEYLRRLDALFRRARALQDPQAADRASLAVLDALRAAVPKAPTKLLFEVSKYLAWRAATREGGAMAGLRMFLPKGSVNKMQVLPDARGPVAPADLLAAKAIIDVTLHDRLSRLPKMGRVHIDPALAKIVMPYNRRGDSATQTAVLKGSRYPMGAGEVIRLFVHWTGAVDVDLSIITFDALFNYVGHIAFTNLHDYGCVHSGDVQSAPRGASEFIDFDVDALLAKGVRYVVSSVISYRGDTFDSFPCYAGFMERDALKSGRKYEPESVRLKFDLRTASTSHLPIIFDLEGREAIFADIACGRGIFDAVVSSKDKHVALLRAAVEMTAAKPTAWDVLHAHVKARGQLAKAPARTRTRFTVDNLDIEAVMRLMADHPEDDR